MGNPRLVKSETFHCTPETKVEAAEARFSTVGMDTENAVAARALRRRRDVANILMESDLVDEMSFFLRSDGNVLIE